MRVHSFKGLLFLVALAVLAACGKAAPVLPTPTQPPLPADTPTLEQPTPTQPPAVQLAVVTAPEINSLQMIDAQNGWAVNSSSVLRTNDGGSTWGDATPAAIAGAPDNFFFLDASHGWVLAAGSDPTTSGTLYRTTDGGGSWTPVSAPFGNASLSFTDPDNGWAMIGLGAGMSHMAVAVYRTSDGGATWSQVFTDEPNAPNTSDSLPFVGDKNGLTALDASHAWVSGSEPVSDFIYVYATSDGGATWVGQNPPLPAGFASAMTNAFPPRFFNDTDGVLPVGVYANSSSLLLYVTHDGGQTWSAAQPVPLNGRASTPTPTDFFVWDGGSSLYASHNGGATWKTVATNVNFPMDLVSYQFVDASTGWALTSDSSSHHTLYQTTDGGATWNKLIP